MSWFTTLFSSGVDKVVDSVADGLDSLFTSDEEKLILKNKLESIRNEMKVKAMEDALQHEQEITKRWTSDNEHFITRLVRPLSFAWLMVLFSVVVVGDSNWGFTVKDAYIPVIETLLVTMTVAYFGSRGLEKVSKFRGKE